MADSQVAARSESEVHSHTSLVLAEGDPKSILDGSLVLPFNRCNITENKSRLGHVVPAAFLSKQSEPVPPDAESVWEKQKFRPAPKLPRSRPGRPFPGPLRDPVRAANTRRAANVRSPNQRDRPAQRSRSRVPLPTIAEPTIYRQHQRLRLRH